MEPVPMPIQEDIRDLLADLVGRAVSVDVDRKMDAAGLGVIARYYSKDGELLALTCWDVALAASAGAALAMVPRGQVDEAVRAGVLEGLLEECFHEIANIASRWMHANATPHVKLDGEIGPWDDAAKVLLKGSRTRGFHVAVEGYPGGKLVCVAKLAA